MRGSGFVPRWGSRRQQRLLLAAGSRSSKSRPGTWFYLLIHCLGVHALLTATLAKLWGSNKADACAACMDSTILSHSDWANHKHCNLEPDKFVASVPLRQGLTAGCSRKVIFSPTMMLVWRMPARDPGAFSPAGLAGSLILPRSPWTLLARKCASSTGPHIAVATSW